MGQLILGLYAEGRTDERFLPIMIRRIADLILIDHDRAHIEANEAIDRPE